MTNTDNIFEEASALSPFEKAQLIDKLISSLDKPDKEQQDRGTHDGDYQGAYQTTCGNADEVKKNPP